MKFPSVFIDWITIYQDHDASHELPFFCSGTYVKYDAAGIGIFSGVSPSRLLGSFDTSISVKCDGRRVSLSGNIGRFCRSDNLFNLGFDATITKCNEILFALGLPPFTGHSEQLHLHSVKSQFDTARISRLDVTANFATGSMSRARSSIEFLAAQSVARLKRGISGSDSVWWSNSRYMLKAYLKAPELLKHGIADDSPVLKYCTEEGILRVEVELKSRQLYDYGLTKMSDYTDAKILEAFNRHIEGFSKVDRSTDDDLLEKIPFKYRVFVAAWLEGKDLHSLVRTRTLYRYAKTLREYGIDVLTRRNVDVSHPRVTSVDLTPLECPDWYDKSDTMKTTLLRVA